MKNVDIGAVSAIALALIGSAAQASVIVVPTQQPTIQAGINAAVNGDTVLVLDGVYSGEGNNSIELLGKAIVLRSINGSESCVIDVQATSANQRNGFFLQQGETHATVIQGFTITHGWTFNGPGMLLVNSSPTVRDCVFTENHADCWGGALYFVTSNANFDDCRFVNNFSADDGGAVFGFDGSPVFTNCLFADNTAPAAAGAILTYASGHAPRLVNCTVTGNSANLGGAIYSNNLIIENSIIWGNTSNTAQIYAPSGSTLAVRYSNVQGGFDGTGNLNVTPQFDTFGSGKGDDFHLMPGSPCIDAGDPATVVPEGAFDLDGDPRKFGSRIDMGIDEFRRAGDVTGDHIVNVDDLIAVIVAWGPCTWSTADLNHDFQVNVDDMITVILNWG